jgi:hypothetical protein
MCFPFLCLFYRRFQLFFEIPFAFQCPPLPEHFPFCERTFQAVSQTLRHWTCCAGYRSVENPFTGFLKGSGRTFLKRLFKGWTIFVELALRLIRLMVFKCLKTALPIKVSMIANGVGMLTGEFADLLCPETFGSQHNRFAPFHYDGGGMIKTFLVDGCYFLL